MKHFLTDGDLQRVCIKNAMPANCTKLNQFRLCKTISHAKIFQFASPFTNSAGYLIYFNLHSKSIFASKLHISSYHISYIAHVTCNNNCLQFAFYFSLQFLCFVDYLRMFHVLPNTMTSLFV